MPPVQNEWDEVAGFLDGNPAALEGTRCPRPVLGDPALYAPQATDRFISAIGNPRVRLNVCESLRGRGAQFVSVIHPLAVVSPTATIGTGTVVGAGGAASANTVIGEFSLLIGHAVVGHDSVIGRSCNLAPGSVISGKCRLGEGVSVGTNASVLPLAEVGDYAVIGAGSVVLRKVPAGATVMGVPAKQIAGF